MNEQSSPRKLTRSRSDRYVGGVASGVANYLGIPPLVLRAIFAISIVFGAVGGFAYLALLLLMPEDESVQATESPLDNNRMAVVGGAAFLCVIASLAILQGGFAAWLFGFAAGFLAGLAAWSIAVIVVIWLGGEAMRGERRPKSSPPVVNSQTPSTPPPAQEKETEVLAASESETSEPKTQEAPTKTLAETPSATAPVAGSVPRQSRAGTTGPRKRAPQQSRDRTAGKVIAWIVVGFASLIAFSVFFGTAFWVTAAYGAIPVASVVVLLGAGVAFSAMSSRRILAAWLLGAAISLAIPMAFVSIIDLRIEGPYGDINKEPRVAGSIPADGYEIAGGSLTIDLRNYPFKPGKPVHLPVNSGLAYTEIFVPDDVCVTGQVRGKFGGTDIRGRTEAGSDFTLDLDPASKKVKELKLDADLGMGYLELYDETSWQWLNGSIEDGPNWARPINTEAKRGRAACNPKPAKAKTRKAEGSSRN